jgi:5-formyltetrahydrofolate cyclo-ligase
VPVADSKQPPDSDRSQPGRDEVAARPGGTDTPAAGDRRLAVTKQALRTELRAQRKACAPTVGSEPARRAGEDLCAQLDRAVDWSQVGCAALYAAVGHELDTEPLGRVLRARGVRTCYPRILRQSPPEIRFFAVADTVDLAPASFGLLEPAATATAVSPTEIDVFIVPGLAFDTRGRRLGQGRGYYDACLQSSPDALRVGVCHPFQQISAVPSEPHDEPMDLLATPLACMATGGRPSHRLQRILAPPSDGGAIVAGTVCQPTESKP